MRRPHNLSEVARAGRRDPGLFWTALDEFLDAFYLDHGNRLSQTLRLAVVPPMLDDPTLDAWLGAVGEHLADRWGLAIPAWTQRPGHFRLDRPRFVPETPALRDMLLAASPPAFRARMIFTVAEPLQRARFPREARLSPPELPAVARRVRAPAYA